MKNILVDTNVFIRLLIKDNEKFHEKSVSIFKNIASGKKNGFVSILTLAEIAYVLKSVYELPRDTIANKLGKVVAMPGLKVLETEEGLSQKTITLYAKNKSINFEDSYYAVIAQDQNMEVITFDKKLAKLASIQI